MILSIYTIISHAANGIDSLSIPSYIDSYAADHMVAVHASEVDAENYSYLYSMQYNIILIFVISYL